MRRLSFGVAVGGLAAGLLWAGAASAARKPAPAYFVKKRGWAQTLRLSREALLRQEAEQAAAAVGAKAAPTKKGGVVLGTWQMIGPFYNDGKPAFDVAFPPEKRIELGKSYGKLKWKACPQFADGRPHGLKADTHGSTYLYRTLTAPKARKLNAFFGSDDGLAVWLNGRKVVSKNVLRGVSGEQDKVSLALTKGVNHLLLRIYNARGAHGFYFSTSGKARGGRRRGKDPRQEAREAIWALLARAFRDPISQREMSRERRDGIWKADWPEGKLDVLAARYVKAIPIPSLTAEARKLLPAVKTAAELAEIRALYHRGHRISEASSLVTPEAFEAVRLAVADLAETFPKRYTKGSDYVKRLGGIEARARELSARVANSDASAVELLAGVGEQLAALRREALLANPLLEFDRILLIRRNFGGPAARKVISNSLGMPSLNSHIHTTIRNAVGGWDDELAVLSGLRGGGTFTPVFKPEGGRILCDVDLHFDASRLLLSMCGAHDRWQVFELTLPAAGGPGAKLRQLTPGDLPDVDHFDACYLPNGTIAFTSTATFQGLPCEYGGKPVSQMFLMGGEGGNIRQITFDQDADWCPTVLNNGRLMYLRWEYTDTPHYFTRLLFHCNPDGTGQMEYYGSNSYFPNSFFFARPIPGHPTRVVGVAGGHHGISRSGRLLLLDPDKGRHEADGIVQEIPGRGKAVEPIIRDRLVDGVWPQFLHPYPLGDPPRAALGQPVPGAGKYFLVAAKLTPDALWGIYLADVFDNLTLIKEVDGQALLEPLPLRRTPRPPLIPRRVDLDRTDALVYLTDIYRGGGLREVPRGAVERLRLISYHYAYNRRGGHSSVGIESSWDIKRVLGTVPVEADGSAYFRIPANTPVAVQPLDAEGRALQLMRSWFVGMPGEVVSCVGCHESQNEGPSAGDVLAVRRAASEIEPWLGPARPFGFATEVQPVLDKFCVGCHDGRKRAEGKARPNLADTSRDSTDVAWRPTIRKFGNSYAALQPYVRRPGPEGDYHMLLPMEYHAGTSPLIQMLKKGHHNVALDREGWDRLYTWIDLNAPYAGHWAPDTWREIDQRKRRCELSKRYANVETDPEGEYEKAAALLAARGPIAPVVPPRTPAPKIAVPQVPGWPFDPAAAKARQAAAGKQTRRTIDLGEGVTMELALIPAGRFVMGDAAGCADERPLTRVRIDRPFWMGVCEVSNGQFRRFDAAHDSRYIDRSGKDHGNRGHPANGDGQPAIRVTWRRAMAFCRWLGERTGRPFNLPTEAQWEWACRAGAHTPMWFGDLAADFAAFDNLADSSSAKARTTPFPHVRTVNDGQSMPLTTGRYQESPWGLKDMHGNVAEWTRSAYRPYPYSPADGRNDPAADGRRVARGGSWRDLPNRSRAAFRLPYQPYQPVVNVGFRVVCEAAGARGGPT